ncbi:MAG: glycerophosphoryl diester phosphodiesterase [Mucilaginibacter polytrichastri]|nr:glycerophosphoryl diester phosphodiesterase [Mucilaginibacter polytrichastri]
MKSVFLLIGFSLIGAWACAQNSLSLANAHIRISWKKAAKGWTVAEMAVNKKGRWETLPGVSGENTLLYATEKPDPKSARQFDKSTGGVFPESAYHYQAKQWDECTNAVSLNTAGEAQHFYYQKAEKLGKDHIRFTSDTETAVFTGDFMLDERFPTDLKIRQHMEAKKPGYFSLATPTLLSVDKNALSWASVPGYFQGNSMQPDFVKAYAYGMGVPGLPVVYRERCASTLCPLVSAKNGVTVSVIPDPGLARDPWAKDTITQTDWFIGLSHMNRRAQLAPTLYYPVLGEERSHMEKGDTLSYGFRYSLVNGDWFKAINHAVYDVYRFKETLALRQSRQSLANRVEKMHHYLTDPVTSLWHVEDFKGMKIGAQSYLGGVVGSNRDAMKNADYGAMWYLASATGDPLLRKNVLPYALNFKLAQQVDSGFFRGAVAGQYYLAKSKKFTEEWGDVVEPVAVTYYTMLDIGNMLLFEPADEKLKNGLKNGAGFLLKTQHADGGWEVAYDHKTEKPIFRDIPDVRPTFYGLIVAYRILKDPEYLAAAKKGADWFIKNASEKGFYLGVCGDARYAPDFATGQSAQALLDLYDLTKDSRYLDAAISAAKVYVNSVYTHPIAGTQKKEVKGVAREDWEITQSGLSFEHGGIFGSATRNGPIALCSHAGLFIRMFKMTGELIFADMARAAAIGRDAFVDPKTSVASYYWHTMNAGSGPYPHHAWWQIGWITDYLMAETELRSNGEVSFPRGFVERR